MLSQSELDQLCQRLGLSPAAQAIIAEIRVSAPVRRVRSATGNVSVRYPSRKMGFTIQAESHKNELAGVYEKEHDDQVLEYYDQPGQLPLEYAAKSGRQVKVLHTPDFFVIRSDAVGWEEWKTEEELRQLGDKMPHRYHREEAGDWRCPPGEGYTEPLGLFYRVRSSAEIDWVFQRNLRFLEDYLRSDCPEAKEEVWERVQALIQQQPGMTLDELQKVLGNGQNDDIYRLIATEQIYVDLRMAALVEAKRVRVFRDEAIARAYMVVAETRREVSVSSPCVVNVEVGASIMWDRRNWLIANLGESKTWLRDQEGMLIELANPVFESLVKEGHIVGVAEPVSPELSEKARDMLRRAGPEDLQEANRRYQFIAPLLKGQSEGDSLVPTRTRRQWLAQYRQAEQIHGCGYVGLVPRWRQRGNRTPKLPEAT